MNCNITMGSHSCGVCMLLQTPDQCLLGLDFLIHHWVDINLNTNSVEIMGEEFLDTMQGTMSCMDVKVS